MIRPANLSDLPRLLEIYAAARAYMRQTGNPTQWGSRYPAEETLRADIAAGQLYAVEKETGGLCGCFLLAPGPDPTYAVIDGSWRLEKPYGVLHRVASDGSEGGILRRCVAFAAGRYDYLRIDTHKDNLPMQRALAREGFLYRGIIITHDGTPRLAYDR